MEHGPVPHHDLVYQPSDIDILRMENELLAYENAFLKSRVAESDRRKSPRRAVGISLPSRDSVWPLFQRLKRSPLGPAAVRFRHSAIGRQLEARLLSS